MNADILLSDGWALQPVGFKRSNVEDTPSNGNPVFLAGEINGARKDPRYQRMEQAAASALRIGKKIARSCTPRTVTTTTESMERNERMRAYSTSDCPCVLLKRR